MKKNLRNLLEVIGRLFGELFLVSLIFYFIILVVSEIFPYILRSTTDHFVLILLIVVSGILFVLFERKREAVNTTESKTQRIIGVFSLLFVIFFVFWKLPLSSVSVLYGVLLCVMMGLLIWSLRQEEKVDK